MYGAIQVQTRGLQGSYRTLYTRSGVEEFEASELVGSPDFYANRSTGRWGRGERVEEGGEGGKWAALVTRGE